MPDTITQLCAYQPHASYQQGLYRSTSGHSHSQSSTSAANCLILIRHYSGHNMVKSLIRERTENRMNILLCAWQLLATDSLGHDSQLLRLTLANQIAAVLNHERIFPTTWLWRNVHTSVLSDDSISWALRVCSSCSLQQLWHVRTYRNLWMSRTTVDL